MKKSTWKALFYFVAIAALCPLGGIVGGVFVTNYLKIAENDPDMVWMAALSGTFVLPAVIMAMVVVHKSNRKTRDLVLVFLFLYLIPTFYVSISGLHAGADYSILFFSCATGAVVFACIGFGVRWLISRSSKLGNSAR